MGDRRREVQDSIAKLKVLTFEHEKQRERERERERKRVCVCTRYLVHEEMSMFLRFH